MRRYAIAAILLALLSLAAEPASAQPVCGMSFIIPPTPVGRSPKNLEVPVAFQYAFSIALVDAFGGPVVGYPAAFVTLTIPAPCANPVVLPPAGPSDPFGVMTWPAAMFDTPGGACVAPAAFVTIIPIGCVLAVPYVTSPDEDGNGIITLSDLGSFQAAFVGPGPLANGDLNRDGVIGLADLGFFQRHFVAP